MRRCPRWRLPHNFGGFQAEVSNKAQIPAFLVPFTSQRPQPAICVFIESRSRQNVSTLASRQKASHIRSFSSKHGRNLDLRALEEAQLHHPKYTLGNVQVWAAALDRFLPRELRDSAESGHLTRDSVVICHEIFSILSRARSDHDIDVLRYLAIEQGRWQAVIWIVKTLLENVVQVKQHENNVVAFGSILDGEKPLDSRTRGVHKIRPSLPSRNSKLSVDDYASNRFDINGHVMTKDLPVNMRPLSPIFQSLGNMILAASEQSSEEAKSTLSYIRQIFAYLHHMDAFPDKIYNWNKSQDPNALQRPPTLHLLSSRILSSLSDAMWCAREEHVANEANAANINSIYKGHEVPGARYKIRVKDLGPEVWMEFLLWSCVDTGYMEEGAWILSKVKSRRDPYKWSVISWPAVQDPSRRIAPSEASIDWDRANRQYYGPLGTTEGYSFDPPLVQLGERTVSAEVVAALIDGLINDIWVGVGLRGPPVRKVLEHISILKNILERDQYGLGFKSWNQIILRLLESQGIKVESDPSIMETVLELAPIYERGTADVSASDDTHVRDSGPVYDLDNSSIAVGLLHRSLSIYVTSGNLSGALRVFSHMQAYMDKNMRKAIRKFAGDLTHRTNRGMDDSDLYRDETEQDKPDMVGFVPWIHPNIIAKFLDLITAAEAFKFGKWLIYAKDVDGPIIRESTYDQIAPALLRFASATNDNQLLGRVAGIVKKRPYSNSIDIALMQCQVKLGNWRAVQSQFQRLHSDPGLAWKSEHAAILCNAILELQDASRQVPAPFQLALSRAQETLISLLSLKYGFPSPPPPILKQKAQSLSPPEYRLLQNTWFRHILSVISSASPDLSKLCPKIPAPIRPNTRSVHLPLQTMTILLSMIVTFRSPKAGKEFFDVWFEHPPSIKASARELGGGGTTLVSKTRSPVQIINDDMMDEDDSDLEVRFDNDFNSFEPHLQDNESRDVGGFGKLRATINCVNIVVKEAVLRTAEARSRGGATNSWLVERENSEIAAWAVELYQNFGVDGDDNVSLGLYQWAKEKVL